MLQYLCIITLACMMTGACARAVLDPAIYLSPGPPLSPVLGETSPEERWQLTEVEETAPRTLKDNDKQAVLLLKKDEISSDSDMEKAETFWSGYRSSYAVPVSFNAYGTYGDGAGFAPGYPAVAAGTIGLAGSGYGTFGGYSDGKVGYSGWGNGKWGHYGSR